MFLVTLGSVSLGSVLLALLRAPEGYEMENGFHLVAKSRPEVAQASPLVLARIAGK